MPDRRGSDIVLFPYGAELVVGELTRPTLEDVEAGKAAEVKRPCVLKLFMVPSGPGGGMSGSWVAVPLPLRVLYLPPRDATFQEAGALESMYREALAAAAGLSFGRG